MEVNKLINANEQEGVNLSLLKQNNINIIIFPDWKQPEESVLLELEQAIKAVVNHPDSHQITLLIDTR